MALFKKSTSEDDASILNQRTPGEKVIFGIVAALMVVYSLSILLPFVWLIINSFQDTIQYSFNMVDGKVFALPDKWLISNYAKALTGLKYNDANLITMFINSMWITVVSAGLTVFSQAVAGYCFAKYEFKPKAMMYFLAIFSLTIPIVGTTAASLKLRLALGLYDNPLGTVLLNINGFGGNFLVMIAIFKNIPWSYAEAVFIDGGDDFTVFFKIMLPQAMPAMVTLFISGAIACWKDYENVLMYMPSYPTLSTGLYMISTLLVRNGGHTHYFAGLILSTIPILIVYICFCDQMMKNISVGGLKG